MKAPAAPKRLWKVACFVALLSCTSLKSSYPTTVVRPARSVKSEPSWSFCHETTQHWLKVDWSICATLQEDGLGIRHPLSGALLHLDLTADTFESLSYEDVLVFAKDRSVSITTTSEQLRELSKTVQSKVAAVAFETEPEDGLDFIIKTGLSVEMLGFYPAESLSYLAGKLKKMPSLKVLDLRGYVPSGEELVALSSLTQLEGLQFDGNDEMEVDLSPLGKLTKIRHLTIDRYALASDLSFLAKLVALEELVLEGTEMTDNQLLYLSEAKKLGLWRSLAPLRLGELKSYPVCPSCSICKFTATSWGPIAFRNSISFLGSRSCTFPSRTKPARD